MNLSPGFYFLVSLVLTIAVSASIAVYILRRRAAPGTCEYFLVSLCLFFLALTESLCLFAGSAGQALFWFKIRFVFNALIPVFFLGFALGYTNRTAWISRWVRAGFFVIPALAQVLVWTNDAHHLFVKREAGFVLEGPFWIVVTAERQAGVGFLTYSLYGMMLLLGAVTLLTLDALKRKPRDFGRIFFICAGGLAAAATALISAFNLFPQAEFNIFAPGLGFSFLLFAIAVFRFRLFRRSPAADHSPDRIAQERSLGPILLILAVLASSIIAVGFVSFREFESKLRTQAENQLTAVATLKAGELRNWRAGQLADGALLQEDALFADLVSRFLKDPAAARYREELRARLIRYQVYRHYLKAYILDMKGTTRMGVPDSAAGPGISGAPEAVAAVTAREEPMIVDFHRDEENGPIHLSLYVPLYASGPRGERGPAIGAVVFRIDPTVYLYPYILKWPGPSATAETILVRRDGDSILYLNDLSHQSGSALRLRFPINRTDMICVQAVLGQEGIIEGKSDAGNPSLAAGRAIPGSPWFIVTRIDLAEIYAPIRQRLWGTLLLLTALLVASSSALGLIWRRQRVRYFRGRAEIGQKLQESLERFELANKATFDVVWDWDLRNDTIWRNDHLQGMFGYRPEELEAGIQSWKSHVHPEDRDRVYSGIQAVIDGGGQFWSDHYRFTHKDGRFLVIFDRGYVIRDDVGKPIRMIGAMQDLTERIRAEQAVLHSRDLMRYIIEHNRSAVAVHDRDLKYLYVSQRYLDEYKVKEKDVIGKSHYDVFPDLPRKWRDVHQKALAGVVSSAEDDPYIRSDGTIDWTRWECRPWYEADGSIGGIIVYTEVVTERKKAQDALRTSLREKEVLLKEIHHRVKNNMQVISSLLNLQAAQIGEARFQDALKETQRRIRSMALLHEKLYKSRDLSRIDFVEYAKSLAEHIFHSFLMDARRIDVRFEMEPAFFDIATANPLGLILNELFSNAVKHAFPGDRKGEILVGLRRSGEEEYVLTVRDDGVGLPPDFDLSGNTSFGVQIIESLVSQLNGALTIGKSPRGASFELLFHELHYAPRFDPGIAKTT
ncbi:MAG: PAS domain-containing protein [Candidatus Aminicenantes bacterium]|nr:PAS domain-containing protein [Candidatus Aminicenantes bacterium]